MIKELFSLFDESAQSFDGQEPGEKVVLILRRHSFTILYPLGLIILLALAPAGVSLYFQEIQAEDFFTIFLFLSSLWHTALWLFAFYIITMWSLNTVIVTDKRIVENEQNGFFHRKVAELHVDRVQDVIIQIKGLIETLFNFGDIIVQTAGSEREFYFKHIANPNQVKNEIMRVISSQKNNLKSF